MPVKEQSHIRYLIILMLFVASCFSYGDRVVLSIVGGDLSKQLALTPLKLGYLFSGFSWAYVVAQLPAGGLLDRYGSKRVYGLSIILWGILAMIAGFTGFLPIALAFPVLFGIRFLSGLAQAPGEVLEVLDVAALVRADRDARRERDDRLDRVRVSFVLDHEVARQRILPAGFVRFATAFAIEFAERLHDAVPRHLWEHPRILLDRAA